jgi:hypothetical protein
MCPLTGDTTSETDSVGFDSDKQFRAAFVR